MLCVCPGAPDRERGGSATKGQAPQHHHADRGAGHHQRALPGYGAGQGALDPSTSVQPRYLYKQTSLFAVKSSNH